MAALGALGDAVGSVSAGPVRGAAWGAAGSAEEEQPREPAPTREQNTHYTKGDLGLVPRVDRKIPTNLEKMRELSRTTRYALKQLVSQ